MKYCCERFKEQVEEKQIEFYEKDRTWSVNGCCGGGCYVLSNIEFCPFCGKKLKELE